MKRLFDFCMAAVVLVMLSPILLVVAVAIKLDSPGPVLFRQPRVGLNGKLFSICKFRSMSVSQDENAPYNTQVDDPRITRVGRFIRATSIDELPQMFNVLTGDMSLVGPRPDLESQEALYEPEDWRRRISVRPGITGLAQINGRSNISFENRLKYDLAYVDEHRFSGDIRILLCTAATVFLGKNVN